MNYLQTLIAYQAWRRGEDERVFEDIGLTPASIGEALDWAIEAIPELAGALKNATHDDPSIRGWARGTAVEVLEKYKEHTR
jgi:hypothetical protein